MTRTLFTLAAAFAASALCITPAFMADIDQAIAARQRA
jgi:hypothetical protein